MWNKLNQRIIVQKENKINNSPIKLCLALLNQEIKENSSKNDYFKIVVWFLGSQSVSNFQFKLFLWFQNRPILVSFDKSNNFFYPTQNTFFVGKIPARCFNSKTNYLTYEFSHNQIFIGKGEIFVNLELNNYQQIDNELIFYDGEKSHNLIIRNLIFQKPKFYFNQHYKKLLELKIQTFNLSNDFPFYHQLPKMIFLIDNDFVSEKVFLQKFELLFSKAKKPPYVFKPKIELVKNNNYYQFNLLNYLDLNQTKQVVEVGKNQGFIFNPWLPENQSINLKIEIAKVELEIQLIVKIATLKAINSLKGLWNEI